MSNKGKVFIIVCLVSCFFIRCTYHKKEASDRFNKYKNYSEKTATASIYREVYKQATDTVYNWVINGLRSQHDKWQIDSLICFNKAVDKVVMSINSRSYYPGSTMDDLQFLYGVKIKEKWYFFTGATCYLPRKNYQKDTHTPLSFAKLHETAMKEVFSGYLIKKKKDAGWWKNLFSPEYEYEVNEDFFKQMESRNLDGTYGPFLKSFEECVLWQVSQNWEKR